MALLEIDNLHLSMRSFDGESQVLNGMAVTLSGTPAERAAALARLKALPQVTLTCEDLI